MRLSDAKHGADTPSPAIRLAQERPFALGALKVDPAGREVERDGIRETLEPRVMQTMVLLARKSGSVVSRDELITFCWNDRIVSENAVNRVMSVIRTLAAGLGAGAFELQTIPKVGYRLVVLPGAQKATSSASAATGKFGTAPGRRAMIAGLGALVGTAAVIGFSRAQGDKPNTAFELYRKGVEAQRQGLAEQNVQAVAFFKEAVAVDPSDAKIWGALALGHRHLLEAGADDLEVTAASARSAAARAIELDPGNADANVALILISPYFRNWTTMEAALRQALKRYPQHWLLWGNLGRILAETGRWREAVTIYNRAVALDQFLPIARARQAATFWGSGRLQEADSAFSKAAERWPAHPAVWFGRFNFLALSGDRDEAIAIASRSTLRPVGVTEETFALEIRLATALKDGTEAAAHNAVGEIAEKVAKDLLSAESAVLYLSALGGIDAAFALLDDYYAVGTARDGGRRRPVGQLERRYTDFLFMPPTAPLRRDPRFARLTAAIGLEDYWNAAKVQPDYLSRASSQREITNL